MSKHVTMMTIYDVEHYTDEERKTIIASYPKHEREARSKGIPILGSGRVFPIAEEDITEGHIEIQKHWPRIVGLDIGYDHPAGAVWMAWDRDSDRVHIYDCWRQRETTPAMQSPIIRSRGAWIPVAWPHDALQHDKGGSAEQLAKQYRDAGLNMLPERSTFEDGKSSGLEAGIMLMLQRMETGRLRVAAHLNDWWEEFRLYHRKDGQIVKERDDLMSATRYGIMMLRKAICEPSTATRKQDMKWIV